MTSKQTTRWNPRPTEQWRDYFIRNSHSLLQVPWHLGVPLAAVERRAIAYSIQEFQLGESSEGKHLFRQAQRYADRTGDVAYPYTLALFIAEENRHARDLGHVLDLSGIRRATKAWPDTVFRWLRHRAGLELSITVLVTAEVIAKVYYAALREATGSRVLRGLCDQICADEVAHVEFQTERLAILRRGRAAWLLNFIRLAHQFFFFGTCLAVWHKHGRCMRGGDINFAAFWRSAWREFNDALNRCDPRCYDFTADETRAPAPPPVPRARQIVDIFIGDL